MRHPIDGDKRPRRNGQKGQPRKVWYSLYRTMRLSRRLMGATIVFSFPVKKPV